MTPRQGTLSECLLCGRNIYSTNSAAVCSQRPGCKSMYRTLNRHPDLKLEDLLPIPETCPCCGHDMVHTKENRVHWATIDRHIPEKGYVAGNVNWLCFRCNRIKDNASLADFRNMIAYLEGLGSH